MASEEANIISKDPDKVQALMDSLDGIKRTSIEENRVTIDEIADLKHNFSCVQKELNTLQRVRRLDQIEHDQIKQDIKRINSHLGGDLS